MTHSDDPRLILYVLFYVKMFPLTDKKNKYK